MIETDPADHHDGFFAHALLDWHRQHGRHDLPWQHPRSPYRVWLAEIMLQQTQVRTVIPYFQRFVAELPDLQSLADADLDRVLALWSGLGYYARARNLHRSARLCIDRHGGQLPQDFDALAALPGIGRSTAGAILAQAHGQAHAILDGNVRRLLCRYHGIEGWPGRTDILGRLWHLAELHLRPLSEPSPQPFPQPDPSPPPTQPANHPLADYTQAQMDLGATVCTRSRPNCPACPLRDRCRAHRQGSTERLPTPRPGKHLPQRHTLMLILLDREGRVMLHRRPASGVWSGLWSLPEATDLDAARTLLARLFDIDAAPDLRLAAFDHVFSHYRLRIEPLLWRNLTIHPNRIAEHDPDSHWLAIDHLGEIGLPAPVRKLLATRPDRLD